MLFLTQGFIAYSAVSGFWSWTIIEKRKRPFRNGAVSEKAWSGRFNPRRDLSLAAQFLVTAARHQEKRRATHLDMQSIFRANLHILY